jgi:hypothetical protein
MYTVSRTVRRVSRVRYRSTVCQPQSVQVQHKNQKPERTLCNPICGKESPGRTDPIHEPYP